MFELHAQLAADTVALGQFRLSLVLLHKDANYPWVILVPKREAIREIYHLDDDDQLQLIRESSHLSEVMTSIYAPTKMNVATLGNRVPQLHLHHVARFDSDPAWPGAVWGATEPLAYEPELLDKRVSRLRASLVGQDFEAATDVAISSESSAGFTP
ncbi:HIT domain-containing protein [Agaribacterium haliotis]|uniref:HIT domain-containing protein n=1 Tax=Agaribacterium haliotis TaxID=2013869 RepID=UPI000BB54F8D|nr:HIT family protein [Agaribacterium haliotis]